MFLSKKQGCFKKNTFETASYVWTL